MNYPDFFDPILMSKRDSLLQQGFSIYPYSYNVSHTIEEVLHNSDDLLSSGTEITIHGRIHSSRSAGKALFVDLKQSSSKIQLYARKSDLSENDWNLLNIYSDIGDILSFRGTLFVTKLGELTLNIQEVQMLCKAVVRLPIGKETDDKTYYQGENPIIQYKERYMYWNIQPEAKKLMEQRFKIIQYIREWMQNEGFIEVQTPTIEMVYGGAEARPFETNIWALDKQPAFLRISPELYLKRYIAGGFEKVFTICQNFRNEGIDKSHNPEFTMMEWYETGTDYNNQMCRFENLTAYLVQKIHDKTEIEYQGKLIDFKAPWRRLSVLDALMEYAQLDAKAMSISDLQSECRNRFIDFDPGSPKGILVTLLFEEICEKHLIQPTFIIDHPVEISPLTKEKRGLPGYVERFEPFVNGMEIGNAYSEMTDPVLQYERFAEQRGMAGKDLGEDYENHPIDLDFVKAIGVGMPPTGGVGFGVDRIIMLLTNSASIREIIPFPMMK